MVIPKSDQKWRRQRKRRPIALCLCFISHEEKHQMEHFNRDSWQKLAGMHLSTGSYRCNGLWTLSHDRCAHIESATEGYMEKVYSMLRISVDGVIWTFVTFHSLRVFWWKLSHISKISWVIRHEIFVSKYWKISELWGKSHDSLCIPNVCWVTLWRMWCGPRRRRWWF